MSIFTENKVFWQLNKMKVKMNTKSKLVSFVLLATFLFLVATVSAYDDPQPINGVEISSLTVDGVDIMDSEVSVIAGEMITLKVYFTANYDDTDVTFEAEIEGDKTDSQARTEVFDIESGKSYRKSLDIEVPFDLKDDKSNDATINIEIDGKDNKTKTSFMLRVQRPSYNAVIKSVSVSQTIDAGEIVPVDIVLKNVGYNDLEDLYVTVTIPALGVEKTGYFGDLVAIEGCNDKCDDDEVDTISGRLYIEIPYEIDAGVYSLEVEVKNDDTTSNVVKQITINNDLSDKVIVSNSRETVAENEEAEYSILLVNPTNKLLVYRIVVESTGDLKTDLSDSVVAVPAGSSKMITVTASSDTTGEYEFNVDVLAGEQIVETVTFNTKVEGDGIASSSSPVVILTVVLAIIFVVLLVVLIILITRKPEKKEEFGESYY